MIDTDTNNDNDDEDTTQKFSIINEHDQSISSISSEQLIPKEKHTGI